MAETREEQAFYGRTCVHGRSTGTPGGFDLMCGDCEMGYTKWVDQPLYQMELTLSHPTEKMPFVQTLQRLYYRAETEYSFTWFNANRDTIQSWGDIAVELANAGGQASFRMVKVEDGYWDQP